MKELEEIVTENCLLRTIEAEDVTTVFNIFSNSEVIRYWDHIAWEDISEATAFVRDAQLGFEQHKHFFGVFTKKILSIKSGFVHYEIILKNIKQLKFYMHCFRNSGV